MQVLDWEPLGGAPALALTETRLVLHHAVQLVAAVGRSLVPAAPDDGHTSLEWDRSSESVVGQEVLGTLRWRAALRPRDLSLAVLADDGEIARLVLAGRTKSEALAWLGERARDLGASPDPLSLEAPYSLPAHEVDSGALFALPDATSLVELARWFADGDLLLRGVASAWVGAAPVRVWPHHFDVGSVLPVGPPTGATLGIGLSPGDEGIAEPYLYVTPWPVPEPLPELPAGRLWHREGWTGALLTGSEVVAAGPGEAQAALAKAFLTGAVAVLRAALEARCG
jgi:hypothetical protein